MLRIVPSRCSIRARSCECLWFTVPNSSSTIPTSTCPSTTAILWPAPLMGMGLAKMLNFGALRSAPAPFTVLVYSDICARSFWLVSSWAAVAGKSGTGRPLISGPHLSMNVSPFAWPTLKLWSARRSSEFNCKSARARRYAWRGVAQSRYDNSNAVSSVSSWL